MVFKLEKPFHEIASYGPILLLLIVSILFEKLLLNLLELLVYGTMFHD